MLRIELAAGKTSTTLPRMKFSLRNPYWVFGLILLWRVALLIFTAQPIPANDAFVYDGGVANWLKTGHYVIPCMSISHPISGQQIYSLYPPFYQLALLAWMPLFGITVLSAMTMHLLFFGISGLLTIGILKRCFPGGTNLALPAALLLGLTFNDRPEDFAHIFGLISLGLVARQISSGRASVKASAGIVLALFCTLYTSTIVGAFYFGTGFLACAVAWITRRQIGWFAPFVVTTLLFATVTFAIAKIEPLWWRGFMENARIQSVMGGIRRPSVGDLLKLGRTLPVLFLALMLAPAFWARRRRLAADEVWICLVLGVFLMTLALAFFTMTWIAQNYVAYAVFVQLILAAGLLALADRCFPEIRRPLTAALVGCLLLVSVRAVGMTTWGAACAWHNSYWQTRRVLHTELQPYVTNEAPVILSSAYLYSALEFGVKRPIHSDWYFDRASADPNADVDGLERLEPPKLILSQFDYYRGFVPVLNKLRQQAPGRVVIHVHDEATIRTPDSIPSVQRVVQHISWAPVIVDLDWKN